MTEPTDAEVEQFIETHPGGCTLDDIAAVLGVTRARAQQIVQEATTKILRALRCRGLTRLDDILS